MMRAAETGRLPLLLLSMTLVGVAFDVKMLAAYVGGFGWGFGGQRPPLETPPRNTERG